jgi:hypothetical protein
MRLTSRKNTLDIQVVITLNCRRCNSSPQSRKVRREKREKEGGKMRGWEAEISKLKAQRKDSPQTQSAQRIFISATRAKPRRAG